MAEAARTESLSREPDRGFVAGAGTRRVAIHRHAEHRQKRLLMDSRSGYASQTSASATIPGNPCAQRIFGLTVIAPKTPATITQPRKKTLIGSLPRKTLQASPAAMNPL